MQTGSAKVHSETLPIEADGSARPDENSASAPIVANESNSGPHTIEANEDHSLSLATGAGKRGSVREYKSMSASEAASGPVPANADESPENTFLSLPHP